MASSLFPTPLKWKRCFKHQKRKGMVQCQHFFHDVINWLQSTCENIICSYPSYADEVWSVLLSTLKVFHIPTQCCGMLSLLSRCYFRKNSEVNQCVTFRLNDLAFIHVLCKIFFLYASQYLAPDILINCPSSKSSHYEWIRHIFLRLKWHSEDVCSFPDTRSHPNKMRLCNILGSTEFSFFVLIYSTSNITQFLDMKPNKVADSVRWAHEVYETICG